MKIDLEELLGLFTECLTQSLNCRSVYGILRSLLRIGRTKEFDCESS